MAKHPSIRAVVVLALLGSAWQVAAAQTSTGRVIRGTVYDSLAEAPLAGARVTLVDRNDMSRPAASATSDSSGQYELTGIASGSYLIGFQHPLLDSLDITMRPRQVQLAATGAPFVVDLAVPSPRTVHDAFCPKRPPDDSTSAFFGHLNEASTRGIISGGTVEARWFVVSRAEHHVGIIPGGAEVETGPDGWFILCDLPAGLTVEIRAFNGTDTSGLVNLVTPMTRGIVHRELYLANSSAVHAGQIVGLIEDANTHKPVANAQVRVDGTTQVATSAQTGRFTLDSVPYGTLSVSVRSIGYLPRQSAVDVLDGAPASITLSLITASNVLDTVRVRATRTLADESGFSERRKAGWGKFFDWEAIDRMQPFETADIVKRSVGVHIASSGLTTRIMMRDQNGMYTCPPLYYLDGRRLLGIETTTDLEMIIPPEELASMEVYHDFDSVPADFGGGFACGAVVMWSLPPNLWRGHGKASKSAPPT
jgi:hypothetical protein